MVNMKWSVSVIMALRDEPCYNSAEANLFIRKGNWLESKNTLTVKISSQKAFTVSTTESFQLNEETQPQLEYPLTKQTKTYEWYKKNT